jgi:hypothetical protein
MLLTEFIAPISRRQETEKVGRLQDSSMPAGAKTWPETCHIGNNQRQPSP